eukprot:scaffold230560_cov18-Prasinocladus_malaysianus.AAC.1
MLCNAVRVTAPSYRRSRPANERGPSLRTGARGSFSVHSAHSKDQSAEKFLRQPKMIDPILYLLESFGIIYGA